MNPFYKNLALWLVITLMMVMLYNLFSQQHMAETNISYTEFLDMVDNERIAEVIIQGQELLVTDTNRNRFKIYSPDDKDLIQTLRKKNVIISAKPPAENPWYMSVLVSWFPMLILIGVWIFFMRQMQAGGGKALSFGKSRARLASDHSEKVTFEDVAGIDEAKEELGEIVEFLRDPKKFTRLGGRIPKGVLLMGPPGTGKTLLGRAIAGEAGVPFFSISGSDFVEMFVGVGASRVRDLFVQGKKNAPCIIFIDEIDAVGRHRGAGLGGGHDEREQTLNQLLVELDGFDPNMGVILMAATNRPEILDPALLRPGRFDRQILVDRPDKQGRKAILEVHLKKVTAAEDLNVETIAGMTPGMVGADLANLVNEAALLSVRRKKAAVGMAEFEEAVERVVAGLEKKNRLINPKEKEIVAHHELGHAIVAMSLPETDPVQKISIIPRGIAALGYTMQVPTEDRFLMRRTELLNKIATLLGGRAAEEIVFDDISTGAHNDLSRATDIARSMVKEYGMSQNLGQVYLAHDKQNRFLNPNHDSGGNYSAMTAHLIDKEIRRIIDEQYDRALDILRSKRVILEQTAEKLLVSEVIDGEELKALSKAVNNHTTIENESEGDDHHHSLAA